MRHLTKLGREHDVVAPSVRTGRDWALSGLVAAVSTAEVLLRSDMVWRPFGLAVGLVLAATMLWRRRHPLAMVIVAFGVFGAMEVASILLGSGSFSLYAGGFVLPLVYSLLRWATSIQAALGMGAAMLVWLVSVFTDASSIEDAVGGILVLLLAAAVGLTVRYRAIMIAQQFEQVRSRERENLARELHDTVAHHVSAITIQAQAGRFLASAHDVDGAAEALRVIEQEASLTLTEMRAMVGALRRDGSAIDSFAPRGVDDIDALATPDGASARPRVDVERHGDLTGIRAPVQATLFRVAQESITNARRHARRPTKIHVVVDGRQKDIHLSVTDDGERAAGTNPSGYGLIGMAERVTLLGGTLAAGPGRDRGWRVEATIPRKGGAR